MTTDQHPITPPPELVQQWIKECDNPEEPRWQEYEQDIAILAARWGADQELEACCEVLYARYDIPNCIAPRIAEDMREWFRAARRPKPPSLKEQALKGLDDISGFALGELEGTSSYEEYKKIADKIRHALEQLDD